MRRFPCLLALVAALVSTAAFAKPKPGDRTISPEKQLDQYGTGATDEDLARAIAAADAHPLGTSANPVRVGGPEGERAYIGRLRCADGNAPRMGTRGSAGVGAFGSVVDVYPLDCGAAAPGKVDLVMDKYHEEHREDRAPAGFRIEPR